MTKRVVVNDEQTALAEYEEIAITGNSGTAIAKTGGIAIGESDCILSVGDHGEAIGGVYCFAKAGENGLLDLSYFDPKANKIRRAIAYIGENGIKADTFYGVGDDGRFFEAENFIDGELVREIEGGENM